MFCASWEGRKKLYRVGIDAGTTVTKLAAVKDGVITDLFRVDSEPSDEDIKVLFDVFLERNKLTEADIESVNLTGVGATGFKEKIHGIKPEYVHEFEADVAGAEFIAEGEKEFLLISLGTGTAYIHVKDNKATHVGGLGMGGGTVRGLSKYLAGTTDVKELKTCAEAGSLSNVNLTMADVSKEKFDGLMGYLTASNFGKTEADASRDDLVAGIYSLVIENVIQTGCMMAGQMGIKTIVMIGGLCNSPELAKRIEIFKKMYTDFRFIIAKNGSYITAIGTAVSDAK